MKIQEIRKLAKGKGIKAGNLRKTELIHLIQRAEGNFECFGYAVSGFCDQVNCLWRQDCLIISP
jgi:hypothetical protein